MQDQMKKESTVKDSTQKQIEKLQRTLVDLNNQHLIKKKRNIGSNFKVNMGKYDREWLFSIPLTSRVFLHVRLMILC